MSDKNSPQTSIASANLKTVWASPITKIAVVVFVLIVVVVGGFSIFMLRNSGTKPGAAQGDGYNVSGSEPRGAVDGKTVKAVEAKSNDESRQAMDTGQSYGGPFVYEGSATQGSASSGLTGFDESGASARAPAQQSEAVIGSLKTKAVEYDAAEESRAGGAARSGGVAARGGAAGQGGVQNYGLSPEAFAQISAQLAAAGAGAVRYAPLANGVLQKPPAPAGAASEPVGAKVGAQPDKTGADPREEVAARAGQICAATPDAPINTDYQVPVFFELQDCGLLTGAKAKGVVSKTPDNFTVRFTQFFLDPKRGYRLVAQVEGLAVSVKEDGSPGVAGNVDNHWGTRLASSALLSLARTERSFLTARGSTVVNTGTSTSVSIDPLTSEEKRTARVAGLVEGGMDVVSKDIAYGVNRLPTMTMEKSAVIGIQFMNDVKVVRNEQ